MKLKLPKLPFKLPFVQAPKAALPKARFTTETLAAATTGDILERYGIGPAVVFVADEGGRGKYLVAEPPMNDEERRIYSLLMESLYYSLKPVAKLGDPMKYIEQHIWEVADQLGITDKVSASFPKFKYYITRDAVGYGVIDAPMNDEDIEEVSCEGYGKPIAVVHKKFTEYDWLDTNIKFDDEDSLRRFVQRLAQRSGKSVTTAQPFTDAMTKEGHRVAVTFSSEVTLPGSSFDIRKFPKKPLTITYLIKNHMMSSLMAAYYWLLVENKAFILILGTMGSGKSVPGSEYTLVSIDGEVRRLTFDQAWESLVGPDGRIRGDVKVIGMSDGDAEWVTPSSFIRHGYDGKGHRITLEGGRRVTVTKDHSLVVLNGEGKVVTKTPDELLLDDRLPVPRELVLQHKEPDDAEMLDMFLRSDAAKKVYVKQRYIGRKLRQRSAPLSNVNGDLKSPAIRLSARNRKWSYGLGALRSDDFARLLGYYVAEGCMDRRGDAKITNSEQEIQSDILRIISGLGAWSSVCKTKNRAPYIRIPTHITAGITAMECGRNAGEKALPEIYWRMPKRWKSSFLKAYLAGDGGVEDGGVLMTTKSEKLSRGLALAFLEFGISATVREKTANGAKYHTLCISPYFSDEFSAIGFALQRKNDELKKRIAGRDSVWSKFDVVPNSLLKSKMTEVRALESMGYAFFTSNVRNGYNASKKNLGKALRSFDGDGRLTGLADLADSSVNWMKVRKVEDVSIREWVYDFSVPGSESFMAGDGVIVHNTSAINSFATMIPPSMKIATIEDSVVGSTEILLSESGRIRRVRIGEYADSLFATRAPSLSRQVARLDGLSVMTMNEEGKMVFAPCSAISRHLVNKDAVVLTTRSGRTIEVTADHSLFGLDVAGKMAPVGCGELKPGDYIVIPRRLPFVESPVKFVLSENQAFNGFKLVETDSGRRVGTVHGSTSLPEEMPLTPDLGFLAGVWLADGFYDSSSTGFSVEHKDLGAEVRRRIATLGLHTKKHSDGVSVLVHSVPLKAFFQSVLGLEGDDYTRRVPELFFGAPDSVVRELLKGYFSGDGGVSSGEVGVASASRNMLLDIQALLARYGIAMTISNRREVGSLGGIGTYSGRIVGRSNLRKFAEMVGFAQKEKTSGVHIGVKREKWSIDPIPLTDGLLEDVRTGLATLSRARKAPAWDLHMAQLLRKAMKRRCISREVALEMGENRKEFARTRTFEIAQSDMRFDVVESVERIVVNDWVYDITVPRSENFVANGIVAHNTSEINLPHTHWERFKSRKAYSITDTKFDIDLMDLTVLSLRYRPDYVIVGEVRGAEISALIQAAATGHGSITSLHAESAQAALVRMSSPPMNVGIGGQMLIWNMMLVNRVKGETGEVVRRAINGTEVIPAAGEAKLREIFHWDPKSDRFLPETVEEVMERSERLKTIMALTGKTEEEIARTLEERRKLLDQLVDENKLEQAEVADAVRKFYAV